MKLTRQFR
jgi:hypothetical protein